VAEVAVVSNARKVTERERAALHRTIDAGQTMQRAMNVLAAADAAMDSLADPDQLGVMAVACGDLESAVGKFRESIENLRAEVVAARGGRLAS
jgi:hypothetical protein